MASIRNGNKGGLRKVERNVSAEPAGENDLLAAIRAAGKLAR